MTVKCQAVENPVEKVDETLLKGKTIGQYIDISVYKEIEEEVKELSELKKKIQITISIPKELQGKKGYKMLRVHEGKTELLEDIDSDENTITIESDQFSLYGIVYEENTENGGTIEKENTKDNHEGNPVDGKIKGQVQTGDTTSIEKYVVFMIVASTIILMVVVYVIYKKRKSKNKRNHK